jgi:hypothetical protein
VPLAAAFYRASGFVLWWLSRNLLLNQSIAGFDPQRSFDGRYPRRAVSAGGSCSASGHGSMM